MDVGIPHSLLTPQGEIVFNDLTGDATAASLSGLDVPIWPGPGVSDLFPDGLPDGSGYIMQWFSGMHGAAIRNPVDVRPHKHGGIVHKFYTGAKYFSLDGLVIGDTPEVRQVLYDYLAGWIHLTMQIDARYFFSPRGYTGDQTVRFMTVRNYDAVDIQGPPGQPGASPDGIAGPKQYLAQFVAANPFAYTYHERDTAQTIPGGVTVDNDGTIDTYPVIEVYGPMSGFALENSDGFTLAWSGSVASGHYIEVDMYNETMYLDGNSTNMLGGMTDDSDFWTIPPGGTDVSCTGDGGSFLVKSNDAWA